jgi:hypothetical protein
MKPPSDWTEADKNDKATVLAAVKLNGDDVRYASDELKDDFEVGMAAINATPAAFANLGPKVRFSAPSYTNEQFSTPVTFNRVAGQDRQSTCSRGRIC